MEPHYDKTKWLEPEELRTREMQIVPPAEANRLRSVAQRALDGAGVLDDAELLRLVLGALELCSRLAALTLAGLSDLSVARSSARRSPSAGGR